MDDKDYMNEVFDVNLDNEELHANLNSMDDSYDDYDEDSDKGEYDEDIPYYRMNRYENNNDGYGYEESRSVYEDLMDALDGEPEAYWNID